MSASAQLRVIPQDRGAVARDKAREELRTRVLALKPGSRDTVSAQRLLAALERLIANPKDEAAKHAAQRVVGHRINTLKNVNRTLDSGQRRDLKMIIHFANAGTVLEGLRIDACAILRLRGTDDCINEVCNVYPGLRKIFNE